MDNMYQYYICVTTAKKMENDSFKNYNIKECIEIFNERSKKARNPKEIFEYHIHEDTIELKLKSEVELRTPLKALWSFSNLLLKEKRSDGYGLDSYCIDSRFLKPLSIKKIVSNQEELQLSDLDVIQELIAIYVSENKPSQYMQKVNREMKEELKKLVIAYINKRDNNIE